MLSPKPVGRDAAARKYDIITALGAYALAGGKHDHRLVLRFITLVTARYNWARNELAVGQREIAQLWSVDERTVKREMAKLRGCGWLVVKRQGARGRVTLMRSLKRRARNGRRSGRTSICACRARRNRRGWCLCPCVAPPRRRLSKGAANGRWRRLCSMPKMPVSMAVGCIISRGRIGQGGVSRFRPPAVFTGPMCRPI